MYKEILNSILLSEKPSLGIYRLIETGEINEIIPELVELKGFNQQTPYHDKDVLDHTMAVLDSIKPKLHLRMAALLHDIMKPACFTVDAKGRGHFYGHHTKSAEESKKILKRLGYDDDFINEVEILIRYHYIKEIMSDVKEKGIKKFIDSVGVDRMDDMLELIRADMAGKPNNNDNLEVVQKLRDMIDKYMKN
jgi:tRNA nucleotidyltransferase (CCA-adding enzyme)